MTYRVTGAYIDECTLEPAPASEPTSTGRVIVVADALGRLVDLAPYVAATWSLIADEVTAAARVWVDNLRAAGLTEQPPTDPRARALWLRQRRNTGPTKRPHARLGRHHRG